MEFKGKEYFLEPDHDDCHLCAFWEHDCAPAREHLGLAGTTECIDQGKIFRPCYARLGTPVSEEADPSGLGPHAPGAKLDAGKPLAGILGDFSLALKEVVQIGTFGAQKYSRGGWQKVEGGVERYHDALWRHLLDMRHSPVDSDSGKLHLAHLAWNALAELELILRQRQPKADEKIFTLADMARRDPDPKTRTMLKAFNTPNKIIDEALSAGDGSI